MADWDPEANDLFLRALEIPGAEDRQRLLDAVCAGKPELRAKVEKLLRAGEEAGSFLEHPAEEVEGTGAFAPKSADERSAESPGMVIGPYKLIEQIGEGGMGTVWMAQQSDPVKRLVALKLIKPGMDSKQVLARFEAERQALALMDHPNIAKVFDGGTTGGPGASATGSGRPYFVMELVKGVPLTKYCDEQRLTPRQRLELFVPICHAIQHAHQKGIIHRDIKPSNVLVASYDGMPVPKVIDFGVAKAAGLQLTEHTLVTGFGAVVGTLEYMSPEQAEFNQLDIDTRSDIYSLGVLLYELLTGTTPLEKKRLKEAAMLEVLRIIREEEPPRPSTRLSTTEQLPSIAANRGLEPKKLSGLVRGDLDWIVMKALEKDRSRRYETANGFAMDIQRYLADEPVQACPPSATYRLRKFARRNKGVLTAGTLILLALILGTVISAWQAIRATQARGETDRQRTRINRELSVTLADLGELRERARAAPLDDMAAWDLLREAVKRGEGLAENELADPTLVESVHTRLAGLKQDEADRRILTRLEEIRLRTGMNGFGYRPNDDQEYADAFREYGVPVLDLDADEAARRIEASPVCDRLLAALDHWAWSKRDEPRLLAVARRVGNDPWRRKYFDARLSNDRPALVRLARGPEALAQAPTMIFQLARTVEMFDRTAAVTLVRSAQRRHPSDPKLNNLLGWLLMFLKQGEEAIDCCGEGIGYCRAAIAVQPRNPEHWSCLFMLLKRSGKNEEAIAAWHQLESMGYPTNYVWLGECLDGKGDRDGAIAAYRKGVEVAPRHMDAHLKLADALAAKHDWKGAIAEYRKVIEITPSFTNAYCGLGKAVLREAGVLSADDVAGYRKALELYPREAYVHVGLGMAMWSAQNWPEAAAHYRKAIDLDPSVAEFRNSLAFVLNKRGDLEGAIVEIRKAIELKPKDVNHLTYLGSLLHQHGDLDGAAKAYRRAIELWPNDFFPPYRELGDVLRAQGDIDAALVAYRKAAELDPNARGNLAAALRAKGDLDGAIGVYHEVIKDDPGSTWAHDTLVEVLRTRGNLDETIAASRKAVDLAPKDPFAQYDLATALHAMGDLRGALAAYIKAAELEPRFGCLLTNLSNKLRYKGDLDGAIAACRKAIELDPNPVAAYANLGAALRAKGDLDGAITAYRKAIELDPKMAHVHGYLGACLHAKGDLDGAIAAYRKAIELDPKHASALGGLAQTLRAKGDLDGAIQAYRRLIELVPDFNWYNELVKAILESQGKAANDVVEAHRKALEMFPKMAVAHSRLAEVLAAKRDWTGAVAAYDKAVELDPKLLSAWHGRGIAYCDHLGKPDKAVEDFTKAIELNSKYTSAWHNRGIAYNKMGQYDKAVLDFSEAIALDRNYVSAWLNRGNAFVSLGKYDKAREDYVTVLQLAPAHLLAHNGLAWLLATCPEAKLRDAKRAIELADKAVKLAPQFAACWNTLGVARYRAGDWNDAVDALTKSVELTKGGDATDWFFLAMAHAKLGNSVEARNAYDRAIDWLEKNKEALAKDKSYTEELRRFREEAEEVPELKKK
jgi:tetratricopeptide (TPR) repeat protein/serine/threonine protein kinase